MPRPARPAGRCVIPAPARFDYGNAARATPLIAGELTYLYGAVGHLNCVETDSGKVVWKKDLRTEFNVDDDIPWGMCSSPLLVDDKLIVNPGAAEASLVALNPADGHVIWKTAGDSAAFSSFIVGTFGGKRQLVGYDKTSLGGWDIETGARCGGSCLRTTMTSTCPRRSSSKAS